MDLEAPSGLEAPPDLEGQEPLRRDVSSGRVDPGRAGFRVPGPRSRESSIRSRPPTALFVKDSPRYPLLMRDFDARSSVEFGRN